MSNRSKGMWLVLSFSALALLTMLWGAGTGLSEAQDDTMHDCPQAGKWAISVWDGPDGTDATEALDTCGAGAVDFAYHFDASTWSWLRWFPDHPEISTLLTLDNLQGIVAHGSPGASGLSNPGPSASTAEQGTMHNCPQEGEWAISVWDGPDGTDATEALDTCGEEAVGVAYYLDPDTQAWLRWFRDRPEISNLGTLDHMQGLIVFGGTLPAESCAPVFPGTYYGTVIVGGQPAPDGITIWGLIDGITWATTTTSGGRYVFEVPLGMPVTPPCFAGGTLSFTCDGAAAAECDTWHAGPQPFNLTCGEPPAEVTVRVDQGISVEALGVLAPGVGAFTINATYNPSTLTPLECSVDPAFDVGLCNPDAGPSTVVASGIEAECGLSGRVPLATMPFEPSPPVCPDDLVVSMKTFATCEGVDTPVTIDDKWWVGDADRDFDKDAVDALFILQYVVGLRAGGDQCPPPPGAIHLPSADADCDGDVDAVDALFVLQHVVGLRPVLCTPGPLELGTLFAYSGDLAEYGPPIRNGADLAASHVNSAGGVLSQNIQLLHRDSGTSPEIGVNQARTLVDVDGVPAIVGALASGVTIPVAEFVTIPERVVLISPASTSPAISTLDDNDYVFRTVMSDASQGIILASLAQEQGFGKAATLYLNNTYGQGISDEFTAAFEGLGGVVTATVPYEEGQLTCDDELLEATAGNPDVLVAILYPGEAIVCLSEAIDGGYIDTFLLTDGAKSQDVIDGVEAAVGPGALDGTYGTAPAAMETEGSAIFNAAYEAEYGEPPPWPFVNMAYDAVVLLTLAAEKAGSVNSAAIRDALRDVANPPGEVVGPGNAGIEQALQLVRLGEDINYEGASGPVDLDENGDVTCGAVQVWKIEGGTFVNVRVEIVGPCGP